MSRPASITAVSASATPASIPGPNAVPLLGWRGNMLRLLSDPINYMMDLYRDYGDVVTLARGNNEFVFVFSPEYNHQLLSDPGLFYNGEVNAPGSIVSIPEESSARRLFSGITTMNAGKHRQQRRLLMPAFHRSHIEALRGQMVETIERRLENWRIGDEANLLAEMKSLTLAVAVRSILGLDPEREGDNVRRLMERWLRIALSPGVVALPYNLPGLPFSRMLKLSTGVEAEIRAMIARRQERGFGDKVDALSLLLQAHDEDGTRLTDNELLGQTTALFIAGHETTASALTWALFLLAQHPQVYSDLMEELETQLHGKAPDIEQMSRLPLLDAAIKESMRLFPPGLWFLRVAMQPTHFGQYEIPEGTRILWTPTVTHRMPELYPEPEKFLPERWESIDPSPYEYLPFSAGPRRCLGATFATVEMKLALPLILQRYRLDLLPGTRVDLGGSPLAAPRGGIRVKIGRQRGKPVKVGVTGNIHKLVDLA